MKVGISNENRLSFSVGLVSDILVPFIVHARQIYVLKDKTKKNEMSLE